MASEVGVVILLRAARRLPDAALREEAARLVVRQRIAASGFPEVRAAAETVEAAVLRQGTNPVALAGRPVTQATLDGGALPGRTVVARQRPVLGTAALLGRAPARPGVSVFPAVPLRAALEVRVTGLSRPVTVCAAGRALDPTPCIAPSDVIPGSPLASVSEAGDVRVAERVQAEDVVELARAGAVLRVPLSIGGALVGTLAWPVVFERPPDVVLSGKRPGDPGPDLAVNVWRLDQGRLLYRIDGAGPSLSAVVEVGDAGSFRVVSRGAAGADGPAGMDGSDGTPGLDGMSATCPFSTGSDGARGGNGGPGTNGGDGRPGGRGGDVTVQVFAADHREETVKLVRAGIVSEGGPGGRGGSGGRGGKGGHGGRGGSGTSCTDPEGRSTSLGGGLDGMSGADGLDGASGQSGPSGPPGSVRLVEENRT
jgi:hypothetical protein